jgi:hypothetical protein
LLIFYMPPTILHPVAIQLKFQTVGLENSQVPGVLPFRCRLTCRVTGVAVVVGVEDIVGPDVQRLL